MYKARLKSVKETQNYYIVEAETQKGKWSLFAEKKRVPDILNMVGQEISFTAEKNSKGNWVIKELLKEEKPAKGGDTRDPQIAAMTIIKAAMDKATKPEEIKKWAVAATSVYKEILKTLKAGEENENATD